MCYKIYLLFASLYTFSNGAIELVVVGGSNVQCSGSTVTLQCTLSGDYLIWMTPQGAINQGRGSQGVESTNGYEITFTELNSTHLESNLTFSYTSGINISCRNHDDSLSDIISLRGDGPPGAPERPLTSLERIERVNKTFSSVSVVWNIPNTNNTHISSYVMTVDPPISLPDDGVITEDNPLFNTRQLTLTLQHDQQYNIGVRANSCNDRVNGTTSDPLTINVQVPQPVTRCTAIAVYDYYSNHLTRVEIEWDPLPVLDEVIIDNITAMVQSYIITILSNDGDSTTIILSSNICNKTSCSYVHSLSSPIVSSGALSLSVIAKNLLSYGYSEAKECGNTTIKSTNDVFTVTQKQRVGTEEEILCILFGPTRDEERCNLNASYITYIPLRETTSVETVWTVNISGFDTFRIQGRAELVGNEDSDMLFTTKENRSHVNNTYRNGMTNVDLEEVVAIIIPSVIILCIISCVSGCVSGASLYCIIISHSCCKIKSPDGTRTLTSQPSQPLYDEIELRSVSHTERAGTTCIADNGQREEIKTTPNDAYLVANLS